VIFSACTMCCAGNPSRASSPCGPTRGCLQPPTRCCRHVGDRRVHGAKGGAGTRRRPAVGAPPRVVRPAAAAARQPRAVVGAGLRPRRAGTTASSGRVRCFSRRSETACARAGGPSRRSVISRPQSGSFGRGRWWYSKAPTGCSPARRRRRRRYCAWRSGSASHSGPRRPGCARRPRVHGAVFPPAAAPRIGAGRQRRLQAMPSARMASQSAAVGRATVPKMKSPTGSATLKFLSG